MRTPTGIDRFEGRIAGFGTTQGTRFVIGMWERSPFGSVTDVMVERADGVRTLLAPTGELAEYIAATYAFDEVRVAPVERFRVDGGLRVLSDDLDLRVRIGGIPPLGRLLRSVPRPIAVHPVWLTAIEPIARRLVSGVHTAGSAGGGRREYYGVTMLRRITAVTGTFDGVELGGIAPLHPPVRFGFSSAPADPQLADVVTTIVVPRATP